MSRLTAFSIWLAPPHRSIINSTLCKQQKLAFLGQLTCLVSPSASRLEFFKLRHQKFTGIQQFILKQKIIGETSTQLDCVRAMTRASVAPRHYFSTICVN